MKRTISTTDKLNIKGFLSEDGTTIEYEEEKDCYEEISVEDLLSGFKGKEISLSLQLKVDKQVPVDFEEEKED